MLRRSAAVSVQQVATPRNMLHRRTAWRDAVKPWCGAVQHGATAGVARVHELQGVSQHAPHGRPCEGGNCRPVPRHGLPVPSYSMTPLARSTQPRRFGSCCLPAAAAGCDVSSRVGDARDCEPRSPRRRLVPVDVRPRRRRRLAVAVHTGHVLIGGADPQCYSRAGSDSRLHFPVRNDALPCVAGRAGRQRHGAMTHARSAGGAAARPAGEHTRAPRGRRRGWKDGYHGIACHSLHAAGCSALAYKQARVRTGCCSARADPERWHTRATAQAACGTDQVCVWVRRRSRAATQFRRTLSA